LWRKYYGPGTPTCGKNTTDILVDNGLGLWYNNTMMNKERIMDFTADQVWGLAVRADITNGGYCKEDQWDHTKSSPELVKRANKALVKEWLREGR